MTPHGFLRGHAAKSFAEVAGALNQERRPHLQKTIGKPVLKNVARDRWKLPLKTNVRPLPELILPALKCPERLRFLGAELPPPSVPGSR